MRRLALVLLAISAAVVVSCADFPTKPLETVTWMGRILDRDGAPLPGVQVFFLASGTSSYDYVLGDSQGVFTANLIEGAYRVIVFPNGLTGYPNHDLGVLDIRKGTPPLEYRYSGALVSGTVTGPGGAGLAGARVSVLGHGGYYLTAAILSSSTGSYSLVLPPADYGFTASPPNGPGIPRRSFEASVSTADTTIHIDLGGHEIRYAATLNGSTPLSGAEISAEATGLQVGYVTAANETGPDGRTTLFLPESDYRVFVAPSRTGGTVIWGEEILQSVSGPIDIPIDLLRVRWDLTLRWSGNGAPIPFARIIPHELPAGGYGNLTADYLGRAHLWVRPQHSYELTIRDASNSESWTTSIPAGADSTFDLLVPPLTP